MNKTVVMTLRLPESVGQSVERLAIRLGHKPAQPGAALSKKGSGGDSSRLSTFGKLLRGVWPMSVALVSRRIG